jgi:hypothetical protein
MRKSFTAVVSRNETYKDILETEPYECAWAGEARWFVRVLKTEGSAPRLALHSQVSPDGLFWCDGEEAVLTAEGEGLYTLPVRNFGGWLRLRGKVTGDDASFKVIIYLVLKE